MGLGESIRLSKHKHKPEPYKALSERSHVGFLYRGRGYGGTGWKAASILWASHGPRGGHLKTDAKVADTLGTQLWFALVVKQSVQCHYLSHWLNDLMLWKHGLTPQTQTQFCSVLKPRRKKRKKKNALRLSILLHFTKFSV